MEVPFFVCVVNPSIWFKTSLECHFYPFLTLCEEVRCRAALRTGCLIRAVREGVISDVLEAARAAVVRAHSSKRSLESWKAAVPCRTWCGRPRRAGLLHEKWSSGPLKHVHTHVNFLRGVVWTLECRSMFSCSYFTCWILFHMEALGRFCCVSFISDTINLLILICV